MDCQQSSVAYMKFVMAQLKHETVEQSLMVTLQNLKSLIAYYMPVEMVKPSKAMMFNTLVELLESDIPEGVKNPLADNIFGFISSKEHIDLALGWNEAGNIYSPSNKEKVLLQLSKAHKNSIVVQIAKSSEVTSEFKKEVLNKHIGDDKSDLSKNLRITCEAAEADPAVKEKFWKELTDPNSTCSLYEKRAIMSGFYSWDQIDICEPYFDKFYEELGSLSQHHT